MAATHSGHPWFIVLLLSSALGGWSAAVADDRPEAVYQIEMKASYDAETGRIDGVERLRWRNTSNVPVTELEFHHYLNAFSNNRTTFLVEGGERHRGIKMTGRRWGWIEVDSMRLAYGGDAEEAGGLPQPLVAGEWVDVGTMLSADVTDLKAVEEFIQPDDGNTFDRTVARYPLPRPLAPGEWVELEIDFVSQLPEIFARTGVHGDYVLGGQWFPKIAVFEPAGMRGRTEAGWNAHQFHVNSEFYADFGDYDVSLTLPARYQGRIGATGRLVGETVEGDGVTARFVQPGVHDFAWTGDPRYLVVEDRFDPVSDVPDGQLRSIAELLGLPPSDLALEPVDIRLMLQPEHRNQADRYISSLKAAIRGYGLRLGAYPYPTLTLVDPAAGARGSGGMEYPTFITGGTHPLVGIPPFEKIRIAELVTIHEFGHNFFQGMIANNEFEEAWIDEGINSYYEMVVTEETYGNIIELLGLRVRPFDFNHFQLGNGRFTDSVDQTAWSYRSGGSYGLNSYARPAVTLRHLERLLGPGVFHRAMRRFFQEWRFRHPSTADFEQVMQEEAGGDISWFLEQALHTPRDLDFAIRSASSAKVAEDRGWFWEEEGEKVLRGGDEDAEEDGDDDDAGVGYRSEVVVERRGGFRHPVTIEMVFENGERTRRTWDGQRRWLRWVEVRPERLATVEVDPDGVLALDVNRLNNSRRMEPETTPSRKVWVELVFWLQNLFEAASLVG